MKSSVKYLKFFFLCKIILQVIVYDKKIDIKRFNCFIRDKGVWHKYFLSLAIFSNLLCENQKFSCITEERLIKENIKIGIHVINVYDRQNIIAINNGNKNQKKPFLLFVKTV